MATTKGPQEQTTQRAQPQSMAQQQQPAGTSQERTTAMEPRREERAIARHGLPVFGPFTLMRRLFDDIEQLWGVGQPEPSEEQVLVGFVPAIELERRGDKLVVRADLPGMAPDDIRLTVTDDALILEGERHTETEAREPGAWRSERLYGRFRRVIALPDDVDTDSVDARFENGVLEVSMRAPEKKARERRVDINKPGDQAKSSRETH
jgi:HSP20 family protein